LVEGGLRLAGPLHRRGGGEAAGGEGALALRPREHYDVRPVEPAEAVPEREGLVIVGVDKEMALGEPLAAQGLEAALGERPAEASPPPDVSHGHVMEIAAPAVVAAEGRAGD